MTDIDRGKIISIAREWIGTPYHHQARLKSVGCDCLGFIIGVYEEYFSTDVEKLEPYPIDWGDCTKNEVLINNSWKYLDKINISDAKEGDIVIIKWTKESIAKHAGILSYNNKFMHAYNGSNVAEVSFSKWWSDKVAYAFSFPKKVKLS